MQTKGLTSLPCHWLQWLQYSIRQFAHSYDVKYQFGRREQTRQVLWLHLGDRELVAVGKASLNDQVEAWRREGLVLGSLMYSSRDTLKACFAEQGQRQMLLLRWVDQSNEAFSWIQDARIHHLRRTIRRETDLMLPDTISGLPLRQETSTQFHGSLPTLCRSTHLTFALDRNLCILFQFSVSYTDGPRANYPSCYWRGWTTQKNCRQHLKVQHTSGSWHFQSISVCLGLSQSFRSGTWSRDSGKSNCPRISLTVD